MLVARACSDSGRLLSRKITGKRSRQLASHGAEGIEPGTEIDGIDRDQGLSHLAAHGFPAWTLGIVSGQGTRRREQACVARLGAVEDGPELRDQDGSVRLQGIPQHGQFGGRGVEQVLLQKRKLGRIDRQQGEAGVELLPARRRRSEPTYLEARIRPAAVTAQLPDNGGNIGGAGRAKLSRPALDARSVP